MSRDFSKKFYASKEWKQVREYILKRDCYMCRKCGASYPLEVHHIIHLTPENIYDPRITLDEKNLITLCRADHFKEHCDDKANGHKRNRIDSPLEEYTFDDSGMPVRVVSPLL